MSAARLLEGGGVCSPRGFRAAAAPCGLKPSGGLDLALLSSAADCAAAGVFTRNRVQAAPVLVDRETLAAGAGRIRGVVANAGFANACTGEPGLADARAVQREAAAALGCAPEQVLVLSTGVIGRRLDMAKIRAGLAGLAGALDAAGGDALARAIMTTDTRPKQRALALELPAGEVILGGVAKGAGMIHPDMATMLAVLTTDAAISPPRLEALLRGAVEASFNRISIDGDTSTNDTVLALANGASGVEVDAASEGAFAAALGELAVHLAQEIVRDGEGATRFVTLRVAGAGSEAEALAVARTIATSPLVKTAFAGGDPNWGRILAAAGRSGVEVDPDRTSLWIAAGRDAAGGLRLVREGLPEGYSEAAAAAAFAAAEIAVLLDLGQGASEATVWTADLTADYVRINADYTT